MDGPLQNKASETEYKKPFNFAYNGRTKFNRGDIVVHFKREIGEATGEIEKYDFSYIYRIIAHGKHTETGEKYVVYESLEDGKVVYTSGGYVLWTSRLCKISKCAPGL